MHQYEFVQKVYRPIYIIIDFYSDLPKTTIYTAHQEVKSKLKENKNYKLEEVEEIILETLEDIDLELAAKFEEIGYKNLLSKSY